MKVPKARKLPSGSWFIQLRLGGESIPVTAPTEKSCIREAQSIKAEYLAGKRLPKKPEEETPFLTLDNAIDNYCKDRKNVLSPSTIQGYQNIRKNQLKEIMQGNIYDLAKLSDKEWQRIINKESETHSPKTVKNSVSCVKTVIKKTVGVEIPVATLPAPIKSETPFLHADEIPIFVSAVADTKIAVPALLALSSMRLSEILALNWEDIGKNPDFIRTNGAVVQGENYKLTRKKQNKNISSARYVPILIPELKAAIERDRKPSGPVVDFSRHIFLSKVHRICRENNITDVTIHGLRHSFASLAYYLNVPEKIVMEIGGWSDPGTVHKIYTHIAKKDISRYQKEIFNFYNPSTEENANGNANEK